MQRYQIIDEPKTKPWGEQLIVDPIVILLAAILVPLFWQPPLMGRFWIPALWLVMNGYMLGSATLLREIVTMVVGGLLWFAVIVGASALIASEAVQVSAEDVFPYVRIVQFGVFFLTMYLVVFEQAKGYALFDYLRGGR